MMACAGLSVKPLGALLPKRTSGTHVVFHLCPCTHVLESGRSKTDVRVCVCAWGGDLFSDDGACLPPQTHLWDGVCVNAYIYSCALAYADVTVHMLA